MNVLNKIGSVLVGFGGFGDKLAMFWHDLLCLENSGDV